MKIIFPSPTQTIQITNSQRLRFLTLQPFEHITVEKALCACCFGTLMTCVSRKDISIVNREVEAFLHYIPHLFTLCEYQKCL